MKYLLTLLSVFLLFSCKKEVETTEETRTVTDTINNASLDAKPEISIKDRSQYSAEFIKELETLEDPSIKNIELIEGYMLLDKDTVYFPSELKLKEPYRFTAFTDTHFYQLDATRINQTAIQYEFTLFANEKPEVTHKGIAHLGAGFYNGSETDEDDQTGDSYIANEYYNTANENFAVRIGEPDDEGRVRATVKYLHGAKPVKKDVDIHITLRQSK